MDRVNTQTGLTLALVLCKKRTTVMGLFSFIKNVGTKLFGTALSSEETNIKSVKVKTSKTEVQELKEAKKLHQVIKELELDVQHFKVTIDDDEATLTGKAVDQTTKEKVILIVGNTFGIATVDDQMTIEHAAPESKFYTVIKGDTLNKIAQEYYGDGTKFNLIFEANQPMLEDADVMYPGQVLRIPSVI